MSDQFDKLRELLGNQIRWPMVYLFKFVIPNEEEKLAHLKSFLPNQGKIATRESKNGKYVSVSCKALMKSSESIIDVYKSVTVIDGIVSL